MIFETRPFAIRTAVIFFFIAGFASWIANQTPIVCAKRAGIAMVVGYIVGSIAIKSINKALHYAAMNYFLNAKQPENEQNDANV